MPSALLRRAIVLAFIVGNVSALRADAVPGDGNGDGILDAADFVLLEGCVRGPGGDVSGTCAVLDLDGDGDADLNDIAAFAPTWLAMDCGAFAIASSVQDGSVEYDALLAVDGNPFSRWASDWADGQWLRLDYGHARHFDGVTIRWEAAYAREYAVLSSADGGSWTELYRTTTGDGGDDVITFTPQTARYLRVDCVQRGTEWGNSIWEIELRSEDACYMADQHADARIEQLIDAMTLEEKTSLLYGQTMMDLHAIPRLGIPGFKLADGPLGIRRDRATAFPAPIAMASSWDVELMRQAGEAFGREWVNKGRQVMLGPCIGIVRVPHGGRNFETYGEDPFLNGRMAVAMVEGAQSQNVVACVKHYACNNQELDRFISTSTSTNA